VAKRIRGLGLKWAAGASLGSLVLASLVLGTGGAGLPAVAQSVSVPNVSGNWAGYVAPGTGVTTVTGQWTVPSVGLLPGAAATWVGIGGFGTKDLIQTGTQEISTLLDPVAGGFEYAAWYELLPNSPVYVFGVSPGDHMQATVSDQGGSCSDSPDAGTVGTTTNNWSITITDTTSGQSFSHTLCYSSSFSSAEWIHEAPSVVVPIPVGGPVTVTFDGNDTATGNFSAAGGVNGTGDIASTKAIPVVALPVETAVSNLDVDGDGFDVCTYALTCSTPAS
jgi:hypothetical protein